MRTKFIFNTVIVFSLFTILYSCKKKDENPPVTYGTPTAVGMPTGASNSATIDATGGTLFSADGRLEIIIPANALTSSTLITIQPVTNMAPGGAGVAYDLSPNGQQFNQAVTLRFHYGSTDILGTSVYCFGIAYQKEDHIWYSFDNAVLDSAAGTESINTTHFTPYSLYESLSISPNSDEIGLSENKVLYVVTVKKATDPDPNDDLAPLDNIINYTEPSQVSWTVNGNLQGNQNDGTVGPASNSVFTTYTAPSSTSNMSSNPAAVGAEVDIPGSSKIYLISNIKVVGKTYNVDVDFSGTNLFMDWCYVNYSDFGSFQVSIGSDSADISLIINNAGQIDTTIGNPPCTAQPGSQGNLLDITSVTGSVQLNQLKLIIHSNGFTPVFTVDCGGGPFNQPSNPFTRDYNMPSFPIDNSPHTVTWQNNPGELITVTATPQ